LRARGLGSRQNQGCHDKISSLAHGRSFFGWWGRAKGQIANLPFQINGHRPTEEAHKGLWTTTKSHLSSWAVLLVGGARAKGQVADLPFQINGHRPTRKPTRGFGPRQNLISSSWAVLFWLVGPGEGPDRQIALSNQTAIDPLGSPQGALDHDKISSLAPWACPFSVLVVAGRRARSPSALSDRRPSTH